MGLVIGARKAHERPFLPEEFTCCLNQVIKMLSAVEIAGPEIVYRCGGDVVKSSARHVPPLRLLVESGGVANNSWLPNTLKKCKDGHNAVIILRVLREGGEGVPSIML